MRVPTIVAFTLAAAIACGPSAEELNREDGEGLTLLIRAAGRGDVDEARRYLDRGAVVDFKTKEVALTALMVASYCGHQMMVELLVERGATVTGRDVEYAQNGGHAPILAYYKATKQMEPEPQSGLGAFLSVGSMPLTILKSLCAP